MRAALIVALVALLVLPTAVAHVPRVGGGAREIDAARSWAFYEELAPGDAHRWTFTMEEGERLYILVAVPLASSWTPGATLVGPAGVIALERIDRIGYEFATPYAAREVWALDAPSPATGEYALVIGGDGGRYALGFGVRESFTPAEWLAVPVAAFRIHLWEGQPLALLVLPHALAFALVLVPGAPLGPRVLAALFAGSALATGTQMARAALAGASGPAWGWAFTGAILVVSLGLAVAAWRARRARTYLLLAAAGGVAWSGVLIGPALAGILAARVLVTRNRGAARAHRS